MIKEYKHNEEVYITPALLEGYVSKFGIDHWTVDYIVEKSGDDICNITNWGRPLSPNISDSYREFFENYKNKGYYTFTRGQLGVNAFKGYNPLRQYSFFYTPNDGHPVFLEDIIIPDEFANIGLKSTIFYAGDKDTGALPHRHQVAINLLVYGRKRWIIFNANTQEGMKLQKQYYHDYPFESELTVLDWFNNEYNTSLKEYKESGNVVFEFIQNNGDAVYIPGGWSHMVVNDEECIGVTVIDKPYGNQKFIGQHKGGMEY